MEKVGWVATAMGGLILVAAGALVVLSLPELKRYMKIESM
jgi:hypothetical protein